MTRSSRALTGAAAIGALAIALLLWRHALNYFFLYDDFGLFFTAETNSPAQILRTPLIGFYRPLPFLVMHGAMSIFSWDSPGGLMGIVLLIHALNAVLCAVLTRELTKQPGAPALALALFAASPWATEGFLWSSAVFDVIATFGMLLAVLGACLAMRSATAWRGMTLAGIGAVIGAFSKESGVMIPLLALIAMLADPRPIGRPIGRSGMRTMLVTVAVTIVPVAAYLAVRSAVIGLTQGAYGTFTSLWSPAQAANVLTYLRAFVWVPMPPPWPPYAQVHLGQLRPLFAIVIMPLVIVCLASRHRRVSVACLLAACVAIVPVMWFGLGTDTTIGGRFAYSPAVWLVVLLATGLATAADWLAARRLAAPWPIVLSVAPCVLAFGYFGASFVYQLESWRQVGRISRSVMMQVERYRGRSGIALEIQNLPSISQEGPYILKGYAFRCYRQGHALPLPPVKATMTVVKLAWQGQAVSTLGVDPFSDYVGDPPPGLTTESIRLNVTQP